MEAAMRLLGFTGNLLIGLFGLGMGLFYLVMFHNWSGDYGPGTPTLVGVGLLAALWLIGAAVRFRNGFKLVAPPRRPAREASAAASDDDVEEAARDFDPDAALARYMAGRKAAPEVAEAVEAPRGFGRRGL
jgi:hypothetical protein